MIASSFQFDVSKLQRDTGWQPLLTNNDMLLEAFNYYKENKALSLDQTASAHNRVARGGLFRFDPTLVVNPLIISYECNQALSIR